MDFHRIGVKLFATDPSSIHLEEFIPTFHAWIQKQNLDGHLLIDVHDYSHMYQGPGILLVAYEGNLSIDMSNRPGLLYQRKTPSTLGPVDHLAMVLRSAIQACRLLEKDTPVRFATNELLIIANDRLSAPNDEKTFAELLPTLAAALQKVFEKREFKIARISEDSKDRLMIRALFV